MLDEITYPFPNFNGVTVEVWEWLNNFIAYFTTRVVTYKSMLGYFLWFVFFFFSSYRYWQEFWKIALDGGTGTKSWFHTSNFQFRHIQILKFRHLQFQFYNLHFQYHVKNVVHSVTDLRSIGIWKGSLWQHLNIFVLLFTITCSAPGHLAPSRWPISD